MNSKSVLIYQVRSMPVQSVATKLQLQIGCSSHNWGCKVISPAV